MDIKQYDKVVGSYAGEFLKTGLDANLYFPWSILKMNQMYSLPVNVHATLDQLGEKPLKRVTKFIGVLDEEIKEGQEIRFILDLLANRQSFAAEVDETIDTDVPSVEDMIRWAIDFGLDEKTAGKTANAIFKALNDPVYGTDSVNERLERFALTSLADWLGDMVVYIRSEALKFGLPLESILACIMGSNFTKLGEDGQPIKDEATGKVLKGPNFEPPERHIAATLFGHSYLLEQFQERVDEQARIEAVSAEVLADPMYAVIEADSEAAASDEDDNYVLDEDEADDDTFALPA